MIKKITLHAGHNKQGKIACGASDYLDESKECRVIRKKVAKILKSKGITVINTTVNNGTSQSNVLARIVSACNAEKDADLNVSLHMNACSHSTKDGKTKGVEVYVKNTGDIKNTTKYKVANKICKKIAKIGFTNRGVKYSDSLYFLNHTAIPSLLVEICFVDDFDDATLYKSHKDEVAQAIAAAILTYR